MKTHLTIAEAFKQGFDVDTHVYPHLAYKGPRFLPTHIRNCYTLLEADLIDLLSKVLGCSELNMDDMEPETRKVVQEAGCYLADHHNR